MATSLDCWLEGGYQGQVVVVKMFTFVAKKTPCFKVFALCYSAMGHSFRFPAVVLSSFALAMHPR